MSTKNLHKLFNPKSVAVIGASEKRGSAGFFIMKNLLGNNFEGKIYPVNPEYGSIMGISSLDGIEKIKSEIDIAVIAGPISEAPEKVKSCGIAGVAGVVIISTNDKENKAEKQIIYEKIKAYIEEYNMRMIGPNCFGLVNTVKNLNLSYTNLVPLKGDIAFISQSGAVCTSVLDLAVYKKIGFSHMVSIGPMNDVNFADMIDYFGSLHSVKSIILYIEKIKNIRSFMSAARSVSRVKPIIALKPGLSAENPDKRLSVSDALVTEDDIYDAVFHRAGILRVNEFEELLDCSEFLSKGGSPSGPGLTIITDTGGQGLMAADALVTYGIKPSLLNSETIEKLDRALPANWNRENNVIILENTKAKIYAAAAKICANAPETDALLLICSPSETMDTFALAKSLTSFMENLPCPVFTAWTGGDNIKEIRQFFNQAGIITYNAAKPAVMAFKNLFKYRNNIKTIMEIPIRTDKKLLINHPKAEEIVRTALENGRQSLMKSRAKELLAAYGIPVNSSSESEQPVAENASPPDFELIIGSKTDPVFGPVILFGLGGKLAEIYRDKAVGLPPLNRLFARHMIENTIISKSLNNYQDSRKLDIALLEEILIRISRLVTDFPEIVSLDINPLTIKNNSVSITETCIYISDQNCKPSPEHLIISAYPWKYEQHRETTTGDKFFIRPIRPGDAELLIDHFNSLSEKSVYLRFFSPLKHLSKTMLIKLTQIDYDREIALVAIKGRGVNKKIIGVCRIILATDKTLGEFAMATSDDWQGKGVGSCLLKQCLKAAYDMGIERVVGIVMGENIQMVKLGKKLGFSANRIPASSEYELTIDVKSMNI